VIDDLGFRECGHKDRTPPDGRPPPRDCHACNEARAAERDERARAGTNLAREVLGAPPTGAKRRRRYRPPYPWMAAE
jgi:hypothetical protein